MNRIGNLVRKDWRHRKWLVLLWFVLLAVWVLHNLGMTLPEQRNLESSLYSWYFDGLWSFWISVSLVALATVLVVLTVCDDAPAKRERFLSVRPVPSRSLWVAKSVFLVLFVVAPVLLADAAYLALSGQSLRVIWLGTLQVAVWALPYTALVAAFSVLWSNGKQFGLALATGGLFLWGGAVLAAWFGGVKLATRNPLDMPLLFTCCMAAMALAFAALTLRSRWLHLRFPWKLTIVPSVFLAGGALWLFGPDLVLLPVGEGLPGNIAPTGEIPPMDVECEYYWFRPVKSKKELRVDLTPDRPDFLAPNQEVVWRIMDWKCNGKSYPAKISDRRTGLSESGPIRNTQLSMIRAVEKYTGMTLLSEFTAPDDYREWRGRCGISIPVSGDSEKPLEFSGTLLGSIFEWRVTADLPLEAGAVAQSEAATWEILDVKQPPSGKATLKLRFSRPELWFSRRQDSCSGKSVRSLGDICFVVYDPADNRSYFPQWRIFARHARAEATGYVHRWVLLVNANDLPINPRKGLKLLVLQPRYLGRITRAWHAPHKIRPVCVRDKFGHGGGFGPQENRPSYGEASCWYRNLKKPSPEASSEDVRRFLNLVAEKFRMGLLISDSDDPVVMDLARYVPRHLSVFLDIIEEEGQGSTTGVVDFLIHAVIRGAEESQLEPLRKAFLRNPALWPVIEQRGWEEVALPIIADHFRVGDRRHAGVLEEFGKLKPFYPDLLAEFRRKPTRAEYQVLLRYPGIKKEVRKTARAMWEQCLAGKARSPGFAKQCLSIALLEGWPGSLETLELCAKDEENLWETNPKIPKNPKYFSGSGLILRCFRGRNLLDERWMNARFRLSWFLSHYAKGDFRYDPVLRSFVLKSDIP